MLKATNKLWRSIKAGLVIRGTICAKCGGTESIEAAHQDYSNPLSVIWLCIKCHRQWDSEAPKTK
jgi:ribosomal protein S27AE